MIWNRIINWFKDLSERGKLVREFNNAARLSFTELTVSTLLEASSSKGDPRYKHEHSMYLVPSGFRIKATSGRALTKDEMLYIGKVILSNRSLVRRIYILGWDTFEVEDITGRKGVKWAIRDFVDLNLILE